MRVRHTDDPHVRYVEADPIALWCSGIVEWKVDMRDGRFLMTPIMRDGRKGAVLDATEAYERYSREHRDEW
jgi:hypothetical protein